MLKKLKKHLGWLSRKRHSKGFGIQSPFAYYLVTFVFREKLPYYGYSQIKAAYERASQGDRLYAKKNYRMLFRLVNYWQPFFMVEVGDHTSFGAFVMSLAKPSAPCVSISEKESAIKEVKKAFCKNLNNKAIVGDELSLLRTAWEQGNNVGFLHVAQTRFYKEVVEYACSKADKNTLILIEGIDDSEEKYAWWKQLCESEQTGVSFDLRNQGVLFFDKSYFKQQYNLVL